MDLVEKKFLNKALIRGGVQMYHASDAIAIITLCEKYGWRILGIETFMVNEYITQPVMDHILDCNASTNAASSWREAKAFVEERSDKGYVFEVIYEVK